MTGEESKTADADRRSNPSLPDWIRALAEEEATKQESWPPRDSSRNFDWDHPTYEVYFDPKFSDFTPDFKQARKQLDYSYHRNPAKARQELQDVILHRVVQAATQEGTGQDSNSDKKEEKEDKVVCTKRRPWIVFSAGSMGVGKGYVMSTLQERGLFPMDELLHVDPDMIKAELPEMAGYLQKDPINAATKVHRESTQMADVLLEHALGQRLPTLVDGSLKDVDYYKSLMTRIKREFPEYQLAILHVTASPEIIRSRAQSRAEKTGRAIPEELLEDSIAQVPKSVEALSKYVDVAYTIANEDDQPIELVRKRSGGNTDIQKDPNHKAKNEELTWKSFRETWQCNVDQNCPKERKKMCRHLSIWCESKCPGKSRMSTCWIDQKCLANAKKAFTKAYPSSCPSCTLGGDFQCGICVHEKHWCVCPECGPAKHGGGKGCALTNMFSKKKESK